MNIELNLLVLSITCFVSSSGPFMWTLKCCFRGTASNSCKSYMNCTQQKYKHNSFHLLRIGESQVLGIICRCFQLLPSTLWFLIGRIWIYIYLLGYLDKNVYIILPKILFFVSLMNEYYTTFAPGRPYSTGCYMLILHIFSENYTTPL